MKANCMRLLACALIAVFALAGCSTGQAKPVPGGQTSPVEAARDRAAVTSDGAADGGAASDASGAGSAADAAGGAGASGSVKGVAASKYSYADDEVDVDLTQMSGTAVYSAVYQMMVEPDSYQDKVVKMKGIYYSQADEVTGNTYFFVIVQDATACCAQGIEFVWDDGDHAYPDDYPAEGAEVVVTGRFGLYKERSSQFAYLNHSSLELV